MVRKYFELYPNFSPFLNEIRENGVSPSIIQKIIEKHSSNSAYNKKLYNRYMNILDSIPIFSRTPRFVQLDENGIPTQNIINNKINNDFFSEIVDFKVGYFAGKPIKYSYSNATESIEATGGIENVDIARKSLTDFVTRNNMYDVDMETTKYASICGYSGRLFYHDLDGNERVCAVAPYETIVLSDKSLYEPEYAIRYYETENINGRSYLVAEFYDSNSISIYEGQLSNLVLKNQKLNMYDFCPLQIIPNNNEMIGDAEKVLALIDAYDRVVSDSSNQIEGQIHSKEVYENVNITAEEIAKSNYTGAIQFYNGQGNAKVYKLESNINDSFVQHHLERLRDNIYRFSKTPRLDDQNFGSTSGVSLKYKLISLEAKCGMFQAKLNSANTYMFKLLASGWGKKQLHVDPLQFICEFTRNFPLDIEAEARATQNLISAGLPKEIAYNIGLSCIDDIDFVMQKIEEEENNIPSLEREILEDKEDDEKHE